MQNSHGHSTAGNLAVVAKSQQTFTFERPPTSSQSATRPQGHRSLAAKRKKKRNAAAPPPPNQQHFAGGLFETSPDPENIPMPPACLLEKSAAPCPLIDMSVLQDDGFLEYFRTRTPSVSFFPQEFRRFTSFERGPQSAVANSAAPSVDVGNTSKE